MGSRMGSLGGSHMASLRPEAWLKPARTGCLGRPDEPRLARGLLQSPCSPWSEGSCLGPWHAQGSNVRVGGQQLFMCRMWGVGLEW